MFGVLDFLFAFFGGAYYAGRYMVESNKEICAANADAKARSSALEFAKPYYDFSLEREIDSRLQDTEEREKIWGEVSVVLHGLEDWKMFDRREFNKYRRHPQTGMPIYYYDRLAKDILLAKTGKIAYDFLNSGRSDWCECWTKTSYQSIMNYQVARWITTEIRRFHPEMVLYNLSNIPTDYHFAWKGSYAAIGRIKPNIGLIVPVFTKTNYEEEAGGNAILRNNIHWALKCCPEFFEANCDIPLEKKIRADIEDPTKQHELRNRVTEVLHSLKYWKTYSLEYFSEEEVHEMILDILMADHGKLPTYRVVHGWFGFCGKRDPRRSVWQLQRAERPESVRTEYIEWVARRVKEQGADLHLVKQKIGQSSYEYEWQGSLLYDPNKVIKVIT